VKDYWRTDSCEDVEKVKGNTSRCLGGDRDNVTQLLAMVAIGEDELEFA